MSGVSKYRYRCNNCGCEFKVEYHPGRTIRCPSCSHPTSDGEPLSGLNNIELRSVRVKKKNPLPKILLTLLVIGGIVGYIYISTTDTNIFSTFSDVIPFTKLTFDDPVSGKDIINDLEIIGCDVYEGTLTECTTVSSYNAFLSAVGGKDVVMSQSISTHICTPGGSWMREVPQPRIKLSLRNQTTDIGSIVGSFSIHVEAQRFVIQGLTPRFEEVLSFTSEGLPIISKRTILGRKPALVGTYVFFDNKFILSHNFSRTSRIVPAGSIALANREHSVITEEHVEYPGYFKFSFNTNEFSDGQHSIKIIATNIDGINETQTIKFVAVSEPTSAFYELGGNSYCSGPYWGYNRSVEEKVSIFGVEDKIVWVGHWWEIIDGTVAARGDAISTRHIGW